MSFLNFPNLLKIKVIETGEVVSAGSITPSKSTELKYAQLILYKTGPGAGTEKLRMKIFSDEALTKLYATSAWSALASIPSLGLNWLGRLRFDFGREQINLAQTYWVGVEATGYTRNADTFYLGLARDWKFDQSGNPNSLAMSFYGYRWQ